MSYEGPAVIRSTYLSAIVEDIIERILELGMDQKCFAIYIWDAKDAMTYVVRKQATRVRWVGRFLQSRRSNGYNHCFITTSSRYPLPPFPLSLYLPYRSSPPYPVSMVCLRPDSH